MVLRSLSLALNLQLPATMMLKTNTKKTLSFVVVFVLLQACGKDKEPPRPEEPAVTNPWQGSDDGFPTDKLPSEDNLANINLNSRFTVVSDLDDTLKVTNVQATFTKMFNAVVGKKSFAGAARLIKELSANSAASKKLVVMSGSPEFLRSGVQSFFGANNFPTPQTLVLRPGLGVSSEGLEEYKTSSLAQVGKDTTDPFVLIGDNTEHDPMAYTTYANSNPSRVAAIYIHVVKEEQPLKGVPKLRYYHTPFEVAVYEYQQLRMREDQVVSVGESIVSEASDDTFLPSFVYCPLNYDPLAGVSLPASILTSYNKVKELVRQRCSSMSFNLAEQQ